MSARDCQVGSDWHPAGMHPLHPGEPAHIRVTFYCWLTVIETVEFGHRTQFLLTCCLTVEEIWHLQCSQGICMIIGGLRHSEQTFNSRSTGVSSALLFISVGGKWTNMFRCSADTEKNQKQAKLSSDKTFHYRSILIHETFDCWTSWRTALHLIKGAKTFQGHFS